MKLPSLPFGKGKEGHNVVIRSPANSAEMIEAQRNHRELIARADRAVELAFRHAEEAAALTGRHPPARPTPRTTNEAT
jgi:hypothetical protein